jgi:hypothetical protein
MRLEKEMITAQSCILPLDSFQYFKKKKRNGIPNNRDVL